MQKFLCNILTLGLLMSVGIVHANEYPNDVPLLEKQTSGGRTPPEWYGWGQKVSIYRNGYVIKGRRENGDSPWKYKLVATITPSVIDELTALTASLEADTLEFPNQPECTDLPVTSFQGLNAEGQLVLFAQQAACRFGILSGFYQAYRLAGILSGLEELSNAE